MTESAEEHKDKKEPPGNRTGGSIRRIEKNEPDENVSRTDILDNFLKQITGEVSMHQHYGADDPDDIHSTDWSEYPEVEQAPELEEKIAELNIIAKSIEEKNIVPATLPKEDRGKYKVNYTFDLNPSQLAAVTTTEKPVLVIAGAGSGKTRVIVYRVSWLIERGVDARYILLLTFTRKASREMLERVETLLRDKKAGNVSGGTFHSFAVNILRKYCNLLNLPAKMELIKHPRWQELETICRKIPNLKEKAENLRRKIEEDCK